MKKTRIVRSLGRKITAWLLALVMIASVISVPAKAAENETGEVVEEQILVSFDDAEGEHTGVVAKNPDGEDYIVDHRLYQYEDGVENAYEDISGMKLKVSVTLNEYTCTSGTPTISVYAMDKPFSSWKDTYVDVTEEDTYEITLDLSSISSLGMAGFRIVGCDAGTQVDYTINSATVVGETGAVVEEQEIVNFGDAEGNHTGIVAKNPDGEDYIVDHRLYQYEDGAENTYEDISGMKLKVSVTLNEYTCTSGTPTISVYAMDKPFSSWKDTYVDITEAEDTYEITLDLSSISSLGMAGFRIVGCDAGTQVDYTINSAVVVGETESVVEEQEIINFGDDEGEHTYTVTKNPDGEDYIVDHLLYKYESGAEVSYEDISDMKLELNVTLNEYTCTSGTPTISVYAMDKPFSTWKDTYVDITEEEDTYEITLDLSSISSLGMAGFRIVGCDNGTAVTYTINSAKVIGVPADEEEKEDFSNVQVGEVIATLLDEPFSEEEKATENTYSGTVDKDYLLDKTFTIPQRVKEAVEAGVPLKLNVVVTVNETDMNFSAASMEAVAYAMNGEGVDWKQVQQSVTEAPTTCNLSLDLSAYESIGTLGFRFATYNEGPTINYTIESAQVVVGDAPVVDEDAYVTIIGTDESKTATVFDNPDGNDYIVNHTLLNEAVKTALAEHAPDPIALEVTVSVQEFTCTSKATPTIVLYAMEDTDKSNTWKQISTDLIETDKEYTIKLNLAGFNALELLGMRFVGCDEGTDIKYTIHSAKIVEGTPIDPYAKATLADPGTSKVVKVVKNEYGPDMIADNPFVVPHDLTFGLEGFTSLALEVGVTVNDYTPDESVKEKTQTGDVPNGAKVVIYAQDSKYAIWEQEYEMLTEKKPQTVDLKLDLSPFIKDGTLGALGLRIVDCLEGTTVDYTINYAKVTGEGESLATADIIDLKYELTGVKKDIALEDTEVGKHGKLSLKTVEGYTAPIIVDEHGEPYQLRGASSHGLSWFPDYVNKDAYQTFRDEWGMNMVRIAVYAREGDNAYVDACYLCSNRDDCATCDYCIEEGNDKVSDEEAKAYNDKIIQEGIKAATELGMYIIIDWHVLRYNPNIDLEESTAFFEKYAEMYKDYDNVIFEICNEPTQTEWYDGSGKDIYTYGTSLTKTIRDAGSDALIICGTPSFSAEVDDVATKPLEDKNTLYACHFYSATHYDEFQKKFTDALAAGVPVFISEFGICTASGDGMYDPVNTDKWLDICDENNVSYACWATSNSTESAAYFKSDCWKYDGAWTADEITTTGKYLINRYRDRQALLDKQAACKHATTVVKKKKAATCKAEGYTGDTHCKDCDKRLKVGKTEKKLTTHSWDAGKVTKKPTAKEKGEILYTCTVCGATKKEAVTALGAPAKGKELTDNANKAQYKITKSGLTGGTVEYVKPVDAKAKTVKIPATITVDGIQYKVTGIAKNAFKNNSKIKEVTIGSNVKTIGTGAFNNCKNLKTVKLGKNVKTIGDKAFYKCGKLTSITIPSKVNSIGKQAFSKCTKLKKITIKTTKLKKSNVGKNAFKGIPSKATIKVPKSKLKAYKTLLKSKGVSSKASIKK